MNAVFEKYLDTVDTCLKPLPASERIDIVKEIKSSILEMERENLPEERILAKIGQAEGVGKGVSWGPSLERTRI